MYFVFICYITNISCTVHLFVATNCYSLIIILCFFSHSGDVVVSALGASLAILVSDASHANCFTSTIQRKMRRGDGHLASPKFPDKWECDIKNLDNELARPDDNRQEREGGEPKEPSPRLLYLYAAISDDHLVCSCHFNLAIAASFMFAKAWMWNSLRPSSWNPITTRTRGRRVRGRSGLCVCVGGCSWVRISVYDLHWRFTGDFHCRIQEKKNVSFLYKKVTFINKYVCM